MMGIALLVLGIVCIVELCMMASDPAGKTKGAGFLFVELFLPFFSLAYGLFSVPWILCSRGLLRHSDSSRSGSIILFVLFLPCVLHIVWSYWSPGWAGYAGIGSIFVSAYGLWVLTSRWEIEQAGRRFTSLNL
jgi:hypothetical protein